MLTDDLRRPQPHEVHARGVRPGAPPSWGEDQDDTARPAGSAPPVNQPVHRLRRIRQVSVRAITDIDQALRHRAS
ncbi:hypothetical protein ITP53_17260 [Nonomuraea sp. K274]|uniref:Uncharacterized protein n=1 Tax=Nonomuraea cypriaca TaxID=1187855 RepID=A0A931A6W2_9ACTN|nr:hypothetical protein [Nonomuraea cypriaca]MBF8187451.1 hypothetical protein [Nonomuraea cypriaca]